MKFNVDNIPAVEIFEGYVGKMIHTQNMTMSFWEIKAGSKLPAHSHSNEQISYMQKGEMDFVLDGITHRLVAGDVLVIPPHAVHSALPITDCEMLDVFSPAREDYKIRTS